MRIPKIGDIIDNSLGADLCRQYQFDQLVARIEDDPGQFKQWEFDGASWLPDKLVAQAVNIDQEIFSEVALKHDLKYAYGAPGDKLAKQRADKEFEQDLIQINLHRPLVKLMYAAVVLGGSEKRGTSYSWAFAQVDR